MKAIVVTNLGRTVKEYEVEQLGSFYHINGKLKDCSKERSKGLLCHRAELDNMPKLVGFAGPMWDGNKIRYEDWETYDVMSM